ncbi:hypothetical protein RhiirA1_457473 [Rhizophagus irregularis]|uniref:Protein kinase domain-containing protein n=1 Tax=Rhizophagus irregularis TaxID=588596 RepID=A0A2N0RY54_9GLOM|nr:hypothetical protein RhiirA1_457473 [Rhizophagus irregularis]
MKIGHLEPIVPLNGSVTGQTHAKVINDYVVPTLHRHFPRGNGIFQEDNAAPHRSKVAMAARENAGIVMLDIWAEMKMMVRHLSPPSSSISVLTEPTRLHELGYFHKDFHCGNILQIKSRNYKVSSNISDFGLSGPVNEDDKVVHGECHKFLK